MKVSILYEYIRNIEWRNSAKKQQLTFMKFSTSLKPGKNQFTFIVCKKNYYPKKKLEPLDNC